MTVYKLTDRDMRTHGGAFQWTLGVEAQAMGNDKELCSAGWLHCYSSPLLAVLLNPIHGNFAHPRLFRATTVGRGKHDNGLKSGYKRMTLVKELPLPDVSLVQRGAFGILCVKEVMSDAVWNVWADAWLSGKDRSVNAANAAYVNAAYANAYAYAANTAYANAYARAYAAYAARAAARVKRLNFPAIIAAAMEIR
jgi:hypothetical protein